jgi:hypothetical protein
MDWRKRKLKEEEGEEEAAIFFPAFFRRCNFWFWCGKEAGEGRAQENDSDRQLCTLQYVYLLYLPPVVVVFVHVFL